MIKQLLNSIIAKYRDLSVSCRSIICLSLRLRQIIDLLATDKSRYFAQPRPIIVNYYSFKIFSRFWLVKTTRIIYHNQVLFTKFGKHLRHIESMTSKVQPAADYWTVDRKNLGTRLCYIWWAEKQRWRNSPKKEEIFWMNNKAIIEFCFRRIWRILQNSESVIHLGLRPLCRWITPSLICRILHILLSLIQ